MFDDHPNTPQAKPPSNLPTGDDGKLEDMFAGIDEPKNDADAATQTPPANQPTTDSPTESAVQDDVMSEPSAVEAGVLRPAGQEKQGAAAQAPQENINKEMDDVQQQPLRQSAQAEVPAQTPQTPPPAAPVDQSSAQQPAQQMGAQQPQSPQPQTPQAGAAAVEDAPDETSLQHDLYQVKEPTTSKRLMTIIAIVVVLLILGGGAAFLYTAFIAGDEQVPQRDAVNDSLLPDDAADNGGQDIVVPQADDDVDEIDTTPVVVPTSSEETTTTVTTTTNDTIEQDDAILFGEERDRDADGLTDEREQDIGTDPNNWDSDGDGLGDGDEVTIWKTDPLNPDTDGDGYLDGEEVKNGYNPAGDGRIFEPPTPSSSDAS